eukprot:12184796-Karenia_brevis.AAC.1
MKWCTVTTVVYLRHLRPTTVMRRHHGSGRRDHRDGPASHTWCTYPTVDGTTAMDLHRTRGVPTLRCAQLPTT